MKELGEIICRHVNCSALYLLAEAMQGCFTLPVDWLTASDILDLPDYLMQAFAPFQSILPAV